MRWDYSGWIAHALADHRPVRLWIPLLRWGCRVRGQGALLQDHPHPLHGRGSPPPRHFHCQAHHSGESEGK